MKQFLDPNDTLFKLQMNSALKHACVSTETQRNVKMHPKVDVFSVVKFVVTRVRLQHRWKHAIVERAEKLSKFFVCNVHLCKFCFVNFDNSALPNLSICNLCTANNYQPNQSKNDDGLGDIETPCLQRTGQSGSIGADIGTRNRRMREEKQEIHCQH